MLDTNDTVVDDSNYSASPIKKNLSDIAPRSKVDLISDTLQWKNNRTPPMKCQKQPIPGKEYVCFQSDIRTKQEGYCAKSASLTTFIDNNISI